MFKEQVIRLIKRQTNLANEDIEKNIEIPKQELGDYAFPCFIRAKNLKKDSREIALELSKKFTANKFIEKVEANGPYLNFFLNKATLTEHTIKRVIKEKDKYGSSKIGKSKKIVIDMSSPNIAKPFGIGHLRSTVIGNSLYKTYSFLGYKVIRINHLGDWGTQFGKLITAYKYWGNKKSLSKDAINHLLYLYVKFHKEAIKNKSLEDEARLWFKKLEQGNIEAKNLWLLFKKLSLKEFNRIYKMLNVKFDSYSGEAFYNNQIDSTINLIRSRVETKISDGALIVPLEEYSLPPLLLKKRDDSTLYATRELAAAIYRNKKYNPEKILYVVGSEQKLHFKQVFKVIELAKLDLHNKLHHIEFGLYRLSGKKLSTRKGKIVFMEDVLNQAINLVEEIIKQKNPSLKNKRKIAKIVGIGAIIFADLFHDRIKDIDFNWDRMLNFEGETAPYIQYSNARICSILKKAKKIPKKANYKLLKESEEIILVKLLYKLPEVIKASALNFKLSLLANYLISLTRSFNLFYDSMPVLKAEKELSAARLHLILAVKQTIKNGLSLLGIEAPERM